MAITRTDIAKQLLANGGRIGFKGGADMGTVDAKDRKASNKASNLNVGAGGASFNTSDNFQTLSSMDEGVRRRNQLDLENAAYKRGQEQLDNLKIKESNIPGLTGMGLNLLNIPRQFMLDKNVDYFKSLSGIENKGYPKTAEGYRQYMSDRLAGKIDAAGNLIMGGDDDNNNFISLDTTFNMASNDLNQEEDENLKRRFVAEGGRIGLQEGGGIESRLEQLGGDVSSAEQVLQAINKRLETAESSLGSGGGGLGSIAQPLPGVGPNVGTLIPQPRPGPFMGRPIMQPLLDQPLGQPLPTTLEAANPADIRRPNEFNSLEDAYKDAQTSAEAMRTGGNAPIVDATTGKFIPYAGELSFDDFSKNFSLQDNILTQNPDVRKFQNQPVFSTTTNPNFFKIKEGGVFKTPAEFAFKGSKNPQETYLSGIRERQEASGVPALGYAEGGPAGGIMDLETGRQMYGLGKLVKKVTRGIKKIAKSPIGKAALLYAGTGALGNLAGGSGLGGMFRGIMSPSQFLAKDSLRNIFTKGGLKNIAFGAPGKFLGPVEKGFMTKGTSGLLGFGGELSPLKAISAVSAIAGALTPAQEDEAQRIADETGIDIQEIRNNPNKYLGRAFKAGGGLMRLGYQEGSKEPVAKKTMPLLDMGGKEMDLREDGGFVPIGRMEKADDVPARLSKNEFVFTAEAVRNAGDGDIDKGSEVMYNMMKNLESGGDVSEESQGLEGARRMFQTSQRLEEVL